MIIEPFYFGTQEAKLFGVYHPAQGKKRRETGVVLCYPVGQEYIRSHRTFLLLAKRFASEGFDVLRFDYSGSGDSQGNTEDFTLDHWSDNVCVAINELKEGADISKIYLVGLRLGANIALKAACKYTNINGLILWNPILDGTEHLHELHQQHAEWLQGSFSQAHRSAEKQTNEVLGFALSDKLISNLRKLDVLQINQKFADKICILESTQTSVSDTFQNVLINTGAIVDHLHIPAAEVWIKQRSLNKRLVPSSLLNDIVTWVCKLT